MKNLKKLVVGFLAVSMLLSGCGQSTPSADTPSDAPAAEKQVKDTLTVAMQSEPANLDPHNTSENAGFTVETQIFNSLVEKEADGTIVPALATDWEVLDPLTVRFHIRDDVYFHNGEKMTAEDVCYSIQRACTSAGSSGHFKNVDGEKTTVVDENTVDIVTKVPFSSLFNYLSSSRGSIVPKAAVEEMGDEAFARNPIGTGAFKLDSWETGTSIQLIKNDQFWGNAPSYDNLKFRFISETATRAIELETGMVDVIFNPATTDTDRMKSDDRFNVVMGPGYGQMQALFNLSDPGVQDIRIRQAMAYALDVPSLVKVVYGDYAVPATSVMSSGIACYHEIGVQEYNPEKAKELLAEAGYADGLTLNFACMNTQEAQDVAEILQNMWGAVGIKLNIKMSAAGEFVDSCFRGENQCMASAASFATGDPSHALSDYLVGNSGALCLPQDPKVDELVNEAALNFEEAARAEAYAKAQEYVHDQCYLIPLADKQVIYITSSNVENFPCYANGIPYLGNVVVYQ